MEPLDVQFLNSIKIDLFSGFRKKLILDFHILTEFVNSAIHSNGYCLYIGN